jgi:hypothetical protein
MLIHMLILDGVKYNVWTPKDEEKEFHPMVREHSKEIFGENSIYFDVKLLLKSSSGIGSIPDAYAINFKPNEWYVIENELSTHPIFDHVVKQLTKFINGLENQNARTQILDMLYEEINRDGVLKATVKESIDTDDIYHYLSKLLSSPPRIVIIIDEKLPELDEACRVLKYHTDIIEFKTYAREDAENVRIFQFEPLYVTEGGKRGKEGGTSTRVGTSEITPQPDYTLPILETLVEMGGSGRVTNVLEGIYNRMKDRLTPKDLEKLPSGKDVRWKNHAKWERQRLKTLGYLKKDSPQGIWEITDEGRRYCEGLKQQK